MSTLWIVVFGVCSFSVGLFLGASAFLRGLRRSGWTLHDARCTVCRKKIRTPPFNEMFVHADTFNPDVQCSDACRRAREDLNHDLIREQKKYIDGLETMRKADERLIDKLEDTVAAKERVIAILTREEPTEVFSSACPFCSKQGPFHSWCNKCGQSWLPD